MPTSNDWSKLCPDVLRLIFESLSSLDFHRAKTVCSNWYSISRTCPLYPWRIVFRGKNSLLFDSTQDKIHHRNLVGIDFYETHCLTSYGNWLLILDHITLDFHLVNVFTRAKINLPSLGSSLRGDSHRFTRKNDGGCFLELYGTKYPLALNLFKFIKTAVLWVDDKTGDYFVAWTIKQFYILSYKKIGNDDDVDFRWTITSTQCEDMAYKDNKLYVYTFDHYINIFDFSGDFPKQLVEENPYLNHEFCYDDFDETVYIVSVAVTISGDVIIVLSLVEEMRKFCICKLNRDTGEWEIVTSLGDEMLIFGHGVTIRGPDKDISGGGIKRDSICFINEDHVSLSHLTNKNESHCGVFDLATSTITWHTRLEDLSSKICWFVPGYA